MFNKLVRLGRDAELKYLQNGTAITNLACVYDIGYGDKKRGQWIDVAVFGKQAEALAQYLLKGKQIVIYADDLELEQFIKRDGTAGAKLKCRAVNIDLAGGGDQQQGQHQGQQQAPRQQAPQRPPAQQPQQIHQQQAPVQQGAATQQYQGTNGQQQSTGQNYRNQPQQAATVPAADLDFDDDIPF